jgi:hypothetical protein
LGDAWTTRLKSELNSTRSLRIASMQELSPFSPMFLSLHGIIPKIQSADIEAVLVTKNWSGKDGDIQHCSSIVFR